MMLQRIPSRGQPGPRGDARRESGPCFASRLRNVTVAPEAARDEKLKLACRNLEAMLWQQVITSMRQAYEVQAGVFGGGANSALWQAQLDEIWSGSLAGRTRGLSATLYRQIHRQMDQVSSGASEGHEDA